VVAHVVVILQRSEWDQEISCAHILVSRWTEEACRCLQSTRVPEYSTEVKIIQHRVVCLGHR